MNENDHKVKRERSLMTHKHTLLAGDIGGTKTVLAVGTNNGERPSLRTSARFTTLEYADFDTLLTTFINQHCRGVEFDGAVLGLAGPVRNGICYLTNVPWKISSTSIAQRLKVPTGRVNLLNDIEAMGHVVPVLRRDELITLQAGHPLAEGNAALIAPGTGLGEVVLHRVNVQLLPVPTEAGHTDFAARTSTEQALQHALTDIFGRTSWEHVLSGPGLTYIHDFTHAGKTCRAINGENATKPLPEQITESALSQRCPRCVDTLKLFVSALGAEAGNLGLRAVATAGVYIGGGIAPNILEAFQSELFLTAFHDKGPMDQLMSELPVHVIRTAQPALLGAAIAARKLVSTAKD